MQPQPLYRPQSLHPAFELRYSWTGWPARQPFRVDAAVLNAILPQWEKDGMRLLERYWSDDKIQLTFSVTPDVSPIVVAGRAKGRLQYALRKTAPAFADFSRKVSVCSVGHNCREDVETYITSQIKNAIAEKKGHKISRLSVMPNHIHIALRGNIQHPPQDIVLAFQNNLAYALGQVKIWADTFYVGTFGEYDMWAVRRKESPH